MAKVARRKALMFGMSCALLIGGAALAQKPNAPGVIEGLIPKSGEPVVGEGKHLVTTPHPIENYQPVTDAILHNPDPNDWIMMRGNYEGYGHSKLKQIDKSNVKNLQLVWSRIMETGVNEPTPIVYKGVMFLGNPRDVIQAIDAASGELLWQYRRELPTFEQMHNNQWGQRKRSIFLYEDKVYTVTWDNFLVALDARTGKQLWEVNRGGNYWATNTTGPIVVNGVVVAGSSCQMAAFGCFVAGNDARTGKELWRNTLIPKKGEPGDETWGNLPFEKRWIVGVWGPIIYDPVQDLLHYGSSGVGPAAEGQRGNIGATMAGSNTRFAVRPKTGEVVWRHQVMPRDNWDQECTFEMFPITAEVDPDPKAEGMMAIGRNAKSKSRRTLTGAPCKTTIVWSFDAAKGDFLWAKNPLTEQNLTKAISNRGIVTVNEEQVMMDLKKEYHQCPTHSGGRDWPFSSYNPENNVMYLEIQNLCTDIVVRHDNIPSPARDTYNTTSKYVLADGKKGLGRIDAISASTGRTLWSWENEASNYSSVLSTSGGLLFNGSMDRYFRAFDSENGKVLWQTRLASSVAGTPVTFSVKGRQYVAIAGGSGHLSLLTRIFPKIDQPGAGNALYIFALPE